MTAMIEEALALDMAADSRIDKESFAYLKNSQDVLAANRQASEVDAESLAAFLDLLAGADAEFMDIQEYIPDVPSPAIDWDSVSKALSESQQILIGVQNLLSETLAAMGVADHQFIRVYADMAGDLRLIADHPRREEIEAVLNSPENNELRSLYHAATAGMSLAGGLVGALSVPDGVEKQMQSAFTAA